MHKAIKSRVERLERQLAVGEPTASELQVMRELLLQLVRKHDLYRRSELWRRVDQLRSERGLEPLDPERLLADDLDRLEGKKRDRARENVLKFLRWALRRAEPMRGPAAIPRAMREVENALGN